MSRQGDVVKIAVILTVTEAAFVVLRDVELDVCLNITGPASIVRERGRASFWSYSCSCWWRAPLAHSKKKDCCHLGHREDISIAHRYGRLQPSSPSA